MSQTLTEILVLLQIFFIGTFAKPVLVVCIQSFTRRPVLFLDMPRGKNRMTSTQPLTASERYARSILTAWNKHELSELQSTLSRTAAEALSAEERERMELIRGLGQDLLLWDAAGRAGNTANQNAALALVRHLARYGR